jgi:benzil reductase ((S)-benzoin forming)
MNEVLIITGGNKGLGAGIVKKYNAEGYAIFSISREINRSLDYQNIQQFICDLSDTETIEPQLQLIVSSLDHDSLERIVLINNAGTLGDVAKVEDITSRDIERTIKVNYIAPTIVISTFLKLVKDWSCVKKIINISSGAAASAVHGWSIYCSSKAAIDSLTKVVAVEQKTQKNGAFIISIHPGIIDTEMQEKIRSSSPDDFIDVAKFIDYKNSNELKDKNVVGELIFKVDQDENIESGEVVNLRNFS